LSKKIAVIGIGNTLRRDDGIGIIILESLLKFYKRKDIDYFNFGSASFDLLQKVRSYDIVLFIDGVSADLPIGELKIFELSDIEYKPNICASSTHELNLKSIFEISKTLDLKARIYVAGVQAGDTSYGEGLSDALRNKKEDIIKKVSAFISETLCSPH